MISTSQEYVQKENVVESLRQFGNQRNCDILVLMGMKELETGGIRRDMGFYPLRDSERTNKVMNELSITNREYLGLTNKECDQLQGRLFEQQNIKASRKQILPIVQKVLDGN